MSKTLITIVIGLLISISNFAQQGINYKALIKDGSANILASSPVSIQFIIYEGATLTNNVYQESHTTNTDANGLIIVNIGDGVTGDDFSLINWGNDDHFLNVQVNTGSGLVDLGTTQFMAVPYALQAKNVAFNTVNNVTSNSPGDLVTDNFVFGSTQMDDDDTTPNDNAKIFFNKTKGAFRAGLVDDTYWNDSEVGSYSVSFGLNNKAKGQNSVAMGANVNAMGYNSTAIGNQTNANGQTSVALGAGTSANGYYSTAMNLSTTADALASTAMGRNNIGGGDITNWVLTDPLFEIGNSTDSNNKTNALTVLKNGTITAPSFDLTEITDDKALVTKEYVDANGPRGLERITENDGNQFNSGYRLDVSRAFASYGPIGEDAVDLSDNWNGLFALGATGKNSVAMGYRVDASGIISTAMGSITTASGLTSTAMGSRTTASGDYSTAIGKETTAPSYAETAIGSNNTTYTPLSATSWNTNDRLFVIGNSFFDSTKRDALIVLKDGTITAPSLTNTHINTAGNKALVTKEYTDANYLKPSSNLVPIAYGTVESTGTVLSGTGNFTASVNAGVFTVTVNGQTLSATNSSCSIIPYSTAFRTSSIVHVSGSLKVYVFNSSGTLSATTFQFVIYKL